MDVTADDLIPLIAKLSPEERVRLSRLALVVDGAPLLTADALRYHAAPVRTDEFCEPEDPLGWDAEGWDEIRDPR